MSSVVDIVLPNGLTIDKTFTPVKVEPSLVTLMSADYNASSIPMFSARPVITLGNRLPDSKNGNYKASLRIRIPVLESSEFATGNGTSNARKLAYTLSANVDVVLPQLATKVEINDLLAFLSAALTNAQVHSTMADMLLPN
jgi:hypothetical protein